MWESFSDLLALLVEGALGGGGGAVLLEGALEGGGGGVQGEEMTRGAGAAFSALICPCY